MKFVKSHWFIISLLITILLVVGFELIFRSVQRKRALEKKNTIGVLPDVHSLESSPQNDLIKYGHDLIARTGYYYGPHGKISATTNGLNCQNCHLDAGTRLYSNNFYAVATTYPRYRERSGTVETVNKRIWDCFHRSLRGTSIDTNSREVEAMAAYIKWTGNTMATQGKVEGATNAELPFISRAADPEKGKLLYTAKCITCHLDNGAGVVSADSMNYTYPPLWGDNSYAVSAGMYRLTKLAGFIHHNMPLGATYKQPVLTNEEAWDLAAYINSQPHPKILFASDWPILKSKPIDYPFGPYADNFSETQHKYGPYLVMRK